MSRPRRDRAAARKWGLSVIWLCREAEQAALTAAPGPAPQVNLTVIHVQAGAVLSIGGVILDPRVTPAIPRRDAITDGTGETE
jgi:hypothetical protein